MICHRTNTPLALKLLQILMVLFQKILKMIFIAKNVKNIKIVF